MNGIFLKIVNISISAGWLILAILALRLALRKAPKWARILLWGIVGVRLLFPFSIESPFSLIPSAQTIPADIEMGATPAIDSGFDTINRIVNPMIRQSNQTTVGASVNPLQIQIAILAWIWVLGVVLMLLYMTFSYLHLRHRVKTAILRDGNVFQSEQVDSPFVLGIFAPGIYVPFQMEEGDLEYVIAHEKAHIRRKDHWWKPLGFLLLSFYWFHPLLWLAYVLLCHDLELACDEKVIRELGGGRRADYAQALLSCSVGRRLPSACPLAFGEVGVKARVKSVLHYKKPAFWVIAASIAVCAVTAVCFLTNPARDSFDIKIVIPAGNQEYFVYSHEEISPTKRQIIVSSGSNLGDTEVILKPVEVKEENAYDEATYLTPGMPVRMNAERGAWFQIGVSVPNPTEEDKVVFVKVKHINVRIADAAAVN